SSHDTLFVPGSERPEGTYALFRVTENEIEACTDFVALRTIWYYQSDDLFVASTSQRLIIAAIGDFKLNRKAVNWMLTSGTLGPGHSWDSRIQHLPANSTVHLNRKSWELDVNDKDRHMFFRETPRAHKEHKNLLKDAVRDSVNGLNVDPTQWTLALSGGMDSRSLLYHLKDKKGLNTITWGLRESMGQPYSDATISRDLAKICNFEHEYRELDLEMAKFSTILDRFLTAGEGRTDHIAGYLDGLKLWNDLSTRNRSIIRGYDAMGMSPPASTEYLARQASRLRVTSDFTGSMLPSEFSTSEEDIPDPWKRRADETPMQYRDRLWLEFRTPFLTAALDDIKVAYVEIINPLLHRMIVQVVQSLPNDVITHKAIWEEIISEMFPDVPLARSRSTQDVYDILDMPEGKAFLRENLKGAQGKAVFPDEFLQKFAANLEIRERKNKLVRIAKKTGWIMSVYDLVSKLRVRVPKIPLNHRRVALRAVIAIRMNEMLTRDAASGGSALRS
ncbi:MAG: hypothetical protein OEV30_12775, partial [Ignavibacteria bacterium]|nr:hypothetical protein [Ignavibacteria bacterium]